MTRVTDHGLRYQCPGCGGRVLGLSRFEQVLQAGFGGRQWVASESGAPGLACPFCGRPMRQPTVTDGCVGSLPAGLAACRTCQQVWVPASATDWMAAHAPARAQTPIGGSQPVGCSKCGAPFQPDDDGRCRHCRAQIAARTPVVVFESDPPRVPRRAGLLGSLVSLVTQPVD